MTDILERLKTAAQEENQPAGTLLQEAANEIERLREEYNKMRRKVEEYQKLGEPEF